jgi:hypothetical protein
MTTSPTAIVSRQQTLNQVENRGCAMKRTSTLRQQPPNPITKRDLERYPWLNLNCRRLSLTTWTDLSRFLDMACMSTFRQSLDEVRRKIAVVSGKIEVLQRELAELKEADKVLARLCDAEISEPDQNAKPLAAENSFTNAISFALQSGRGTQLTPVEVRDKMEMLGYDFSKYSSDALTSIHTLLKRMAKKGTVKPRRWPHNRTTYQWIGEAERTQKAGEDASATNDDR